MEKNKKIELFLGFLIIITIVGIIYNEYVDHIKKEGFLPLAIAHTVFWNNLMFFVRNIPIILASLMVMLGMYSAWETIKGFFAGAVFIATSEIVEV